MGLGMTYADMKAAGYRNTRSSYSRGYISRKIDIDKQPVFISGTKELFIEVPCHHSTQYFIRQYLGR
jgi:hypothetical protein